MPREKKNPEETPNQPAITDQLTSAHAAANIDISTERATAKDNSPGATLQYTQEMTTRRERATAQATTSSENSTQTPLCEI